MRPALTRSDVGSNPTGLAKKMKQIGKQKK